MNMKLFKKAVLAASGGALGLSLAAHAQTAAHIPASAYRAGEPDVIVPPPVPLPARNVRAFQHAAFASAYARAKRPSIAVLWNREYSDMLQQTTASRVRVDSAYARHEEALGVAVQRRAVRGGYEHADGVSVASTTVTVGDTKTSQARRRAPVERVDLQMRAAFLQTMASAGVRLVDRNVVMRSVAARKKAKAEALDSQQVEAEAIASHAQLLMEVLATRDAAAPLGWSVFVSIKRIADGLVLAEGYMDGQLSPDAPKPPPRFEADPYGGYRQVVKPDTVADVGRRLGEQTLVRLSEALGMTP